MKLPVVEIAAEAYHFLWRHRRTLLDRASLPAALVLVVGILEYLMSAPAGVSDLPAPSPAGDDDTGDSGQAQGGSGLLSILTHAIVALPFTVGWYRLVILGPGGIAGRSPLAFTRVEGRYFVRGLVLMLVMAVPLVLAFSIAMPFATGQISAAQVGLMPVLVSLLLFALLVLALLRLWFVFPAVSVEDPSTFGRAWEITKGNSLRILGLAVLTQGPAMVFGFVIAALAAGLGLPFSLDLAVNVAVSFITMALAATAVGEAYARLR